MRTSHLPKLFTAALTATVLASATASATPVVNGVFDLPNVPRHLALGPDGNVWVAMDGLTDNIARVRPDGTVDRFTSAAISAQVGIVAGPDGQTWVTESNAVAHFSPSDPSAATRVDIAGLVPTGIAVGPDRNLWTASNDSVVRIRTDERFDTFRPAGLVGARGIAAGGDGNLYVADFGGAQILGVSTAGVTVGAYPTGGGPQEVVAGPSGQMGFTNPTNVPQQIGRFSPPDRGSVRTADFAIGTDPFGIVFAEDSAYWVANRNDTLTRMTTDGAVTTLTGFPRSSGPRYLTTGAGGSAVGRAGGLQTGRARDRSGGADDRRWWRRNRWWRDRWRWWWRHDGRQSPRISHAFFPLLRVGRAGTLKLDLTEAATVTIRFDRRLPGRRERERALREAAPRLSRQRLQAHQGVRRADAHSRQRQEPAHDRRQGQPPHDPRRQLPHHRRRERRRRQRLEARHGDDGRDPETEARRSDRRDPLVCGAVCATRRPRVRLQRA